MSAGETQVRRTSIIAALGRLTVWATLLIFGLLSVVPMIWLLLAPSKTGAQLASMAPLSFGSWANYVAAWDNLMLFQSGELLRWTWNSVWYTAAIVVIASATAIAAGYALAVTRLPFTRTILIVTLIGMIIPPVSLVLPLFIEVSAVGLYDTAAGVILSSSFFPFGVFLSYIHFSTSIPTELYEAARIDGCTEYGVFFKIALPLSRGLLGMLAFFSFGAAWANYFLPYVLLGSTDNYTLPVGLGVLFSSTPALNPGNGISSVVGRPEIALAGLMLAVPIMIVFLASSRLLVRGVLAGSVKS